MIACAHEPPTLIPRVVHHDTIPTNGVDQQQYPTQATMHDGLRQHSPPRASVTSTAQLSLIHLLTGLLSTSTPCPHLDGNNPLRRKQGQKVGGMSIAHPAHVTTSDTHVPESGIIVSGRDASQQRGTDPQSRRFQPGHPGLPHRYRSSPAAERATGWPRGSGRA